MRFPPGAMAHLEGRGDVFYRDSGEQAGGGLGTVLLLHGWAVTADLNFLNCYAPLVGAGYRIIALDHRGHGRGLRPAARVTVVDCAGDAGALLEHLATGPALVFGYSMGGSIALTLAHEHPDLVRGLVLSGTQLHWPGRGGRLYRLGMRVFLGVFPRRGWRFALSGTLKDPGILAWAADELGRSTIDEILEVRADLRRFDARGYAANLGMPVAVVLTTRDRTALPALQRELVEGIKGATVMEVALGHDSLVASGEVFAPALLAALDSVRSRLILRR